MVASGRYSIGMSRSRTVVRPARAAFLIASSHTRRTSSDKGESTRSDVLNPDRARMYSLRRLATIKTSAGTSEAAFPEDSVRTMRFCPRLGCSLFAGLVSYPRLSGAVFSTAQASRWFALGRCTSQQETEQNASPVLLRLHVETLQTQYIEPSAIGSLQALQRRHWFSFATGCPPGCRE